jgi:hypothetical protein
MVLRREMPKKPKKPQPLGLIPLYLDAKQALGLKRDVENGKVYQLRFSGLRSYTVF